MKGGKTMQTITGYDNRKLSTPEDAKGRYATDRHTNGHTQHTCINGCPIHQGDRFIMLSDIYSNNGDALCNDCLRYGNERKYLLSLMDDMSVDDIVDALENFGSAKRQIAG